MMNPSIELTRHLLGTALFDFPFPEDWLRPDDWDAYLKFASSHGVSAILSEALVDLADKGVTAVVPIKTERRIHMAGITRKDLYDKYMAVAAKMSGYMASKGVRTVVMKGFAYAVYYRKPHVRVFTDVDCMFPGNFEKANLLIEEKGVKVDRSHYKHSNFKVGPLEFENHQFCTSFRGSAKARGLEKELEEILNEGPLRRIGATELYSPSDLFNALFLLEHAREHFLKEGLGLRHFVDWAVLRAAVGDDFDSGRFDSFVRDHGLSRFVSAFTAVSDYVVGRDVELDDDARRMLEDTIGTHKKIEYKKGLKTSLQIVRNVFSSAWKYRDYSEYSAFGWVVRSAAMKLFDRKPGL